MKYIVLSAPIGYQDTVQAILESFDITQFWQEPIAIGETGFSLRFFVNSADRDDLMDKLQQALGGTEDASIHVLNVDASYPNPKALETTPQLSREELYRIADDGSRSDSLFLLLVALSTIVASIGLIQNNIAVIVGAMVIAPLLGPNLSFALASVMGESDIARRALVTFVKGSVLAFAVAVVVGFFWRDFEFSLEIASRTKVGIENAVLAFASGVAAVLSTTKGTQSVMVGVMVAVALVPPLATAGLLLGSGQHIASLGALILFAINVAAINFAAHTTLVFSSIGPRTRFAALNARKRTIVFALGSLIVLIVLTWYAGFSGLNL